VVKKLIAAIKTRKPCKGADSHRSSMHGFANFRKFKSPVTLTLDRVKVISACTIPVACPSDWSLTHYWDMATWISWTIDIPWSLNTPDTFPRRKFENLALKSCRPGPIPSLPTISFELQAKMAEEIDVEMCNYWQFLELQMLHDFDLDLGSGQGHINIHSKCRTTSVPNHVTLAM